MARRLNKISSYVRYRWPLLFLLLISKPSPALDEAFRLYNAPQAMGMGNAFTSEAFGYAALYYNPAGLARPPRKAWELTPVDFVGVSGMTGFSLVRQAASFGHRQLAAKAQANPGQYSYVGYGGSPNFSIRGFGFALLASSQFAAKSDGTVVDINAHDTYGVVTGAALNMFGNLLKIGVTGKALVRNQIQGSYFHTELNSDEDFSARMKEGWGVGADVGAIITSPSKYNPSFGFVWKDVLNTRFYKSHILNTASTGVPKSIPQSFNVAFSIRPKISRKWRAAFAVEMGNIERNDFPVRKKLHFGMQIEDERTWFIWLGMNQLYPTAGIGMRLPGGILEVGTTAEDVGENEVLQSDRRIFLRYTIGF